jgi:hypothetical protein
MDPWELPGYPLQTALAIVVLWLMLGISASGRKKGLDPVTLRTFRQRFAHQRGEVIAGTALTLLLIGLYLSRVL